MTPPTTGESVEVLYSFPIDTVPGHKIVALRITYEPKGWTPAHTHGNAFVTVHVLEGRILSHVEGQKAQEYGAGDSFLEAPMAHHLVAKNQSALERAVFIATFIAPIDQDQFVL